MGTNTPIEAHESPEHVVTLSTFYISKTEVTFDEYDSFCVATKNALPPSGDWGRGNTPVFMVTWYDAINYCNWLSEKEKLSKCYIVKDKEVKYVDTAKGYRLPTEAEWEYAAAGGNKTNGFLFSGAKTVGEAGWYVDNCGGRTKPVAQKVANELGIYDMTGNVWEWVWDWYDWNYYKGSPLFSPQGPENGQYKVMRGGAWYNYGTHANIHTRQNHYPTYRQNSVGFRVARSYFPEKK